MAEFLAPEVDQIAARGGGITAFGDPVLGATPVAGRRAQDLGDAILAGIQSSATGLAARRKIPDITTDQDTPWYHRLAANAAGVLTDLPLSFVGAVGGGLAGSPAGPVGAAVGGGAGAFAAPMALREALIEAYNGNHALSWSGVWEIGKAAIGGGAKGAAIGAATFGAGRLAGSALGRTTSAVGPVQPAIQNALGRGTAVTGAELSALTATSAALEGHMPTWQDFMDNALLLGGAKAAVATAGRMRNVYAETGRTPEQQLADAARNPELKAELLGEPKANETRLYRGTAGSGHDLTDPARTGGVFFTSDRDYAQAMAERAAKRYGGEPRVDEFYVSMENPAPRGMSIERAKELGHDGAVFGEASGKSEFVVFDASKARPVSATLLGEPATKYKDAAIEQMRESLKTEHPGVSFRIGRDSEGGIHLADIAAKVTGQGDGPKAMTDFVRYLDENSLPSSLTATETGKTPLAKVVAFYEKFGYTRDAEQPFKDGVVMHRAPQERANGTTADGRGNGGISGEGAQGALRAPGTATATGIPRAYEPLALEQRIQAALALDPRPDLIRQSFMEGGKAKLDGKPGLVAWDYVTDVDVARGIMREATERYSPEIEAQRRGVITNAESVRNARALQETGGLSTHIIGAAENSTQVTLRAAYLKDAANHAYGELLKLAETPLADQTVAMKASALAGLERVAMLNAEFAGVRAESGRTQQMLGAIKRDPSMLDFAEGLLKLAERKGSLQDIALAIKQFQTPEQLVRAAQEYTKATRLQKIVEAWRAGIFSGPLTWQANTYGNVSRWALEAMKAPLTASISAASHAMRGDPLSMAQFKARALAPLYGLQLAVLDGIHLSKHGLQMARDKGVMDTLNAAREGLRQGDDKMDIIKRANTEGPVSLFAEFSFGMLKLQDLPFRTIGERTEAYVTAVDRAVKEGWHPSTKEFSEAVARYVDNPTSGLKESAANKVLERIEKAGAESVFGQQLGPKLGQVSRAISGTPWEFVFPARRTPINLLDYAVQHIPGANFLSSRWKADFAAGGDARAAAISRVVVGSALAATAIWMVQDGMLTGGGLMDREVSGTKTGAGHQNYSLKFENEYYSIQRLEPVSKLFMLAADVSEILNAPQTTDDDKAKAGLMMVLAFGNATISTTYLSGLANTMRAVLDPARYLEPFMESYATTLVPKIIGQSVTVADPYKREVDGAIDAIQSQLPFLREKLLPKRDVWGEKILADRVFDVTPITATKESDDKVKTEAVRLQLAIQDAPKYVSEAGPFKQKEEQIKLTQEQRDVYSAVSGQAAMDILRPIVNSKDWNQIPDFAQAAIYRHVIQGAHKQGAYAALPPDAAERMALRERIVQKVIKQVMDAQGK